MSSQTPTRSSVYTVAELEQHPCFRRTKQRKSRWYCIVCVNPELAGVAHFDPSGATRHETSKRHIENLQRLSQPQEPIYDDLNAWAGLPPPAWDQVELPKRRRRRKAPLAALQAAEREQARESKLDDARRNWRVRMWLKAMVLEAGGTWIDSPADIEPPQPGLWWDTRGEELPPERAWGLPAPGDDEETDPRNTEDFVSEIRPPEGHFLDIDIDLGPSYSYYTQSEKLETSPQAETSPPVKTSPPATIRARNARQRTQKAVVGTQSVQRRRRRQHI